jgi:hypothetical protein
MGLSNGVHPASVGTFVAALNAASSSRLALPEKSGIPI